MSSSSPQPAVLPRRPWPWWAPLVALVASFTVAALGSVIILGIAAAIDPTRGTTATDAPPWALIGSGMLQELAFVATALAMAALFAGRPGGVQFGFVVPRVWRALALACGAMALFYLLSAGYATIFDVTQQDDLPDELGASSSTGALIGTAVLACVLAPLCEELFFRGFAFGAVRNSMGPTWACIAVGIVFGLIHAPGSDPAFLAPLALFGILLCVVRQLSGSILPCFAMHAVNNSVALGSTQDWPVWGTLALVLASLATVLGVGLAVSRAQVLNQPTLPAAA